MYFDNPDDVGNVLWPSRNGLHHDEILGRRHAYEQASDINSV